MKGEIMLIQEIYIDQTRGGIFGGSGVYEAFTGELFRNLQKEYGRCRGKVYIDIDGESKQIGWVFEKRMKYEDSPETYVREVWVTLHESEPETKVTHHYKFLS